MRATNIPYALGVDCPLDDERLTLAGLFFEAHAGLSATLAQRLEEETGLPPTWFDVLLRLGRSHGHMLRMTDLAEQTTLSPSGLTRVVDKLESEGLVRRKSCPSDRRGQNAVLTARGLKRLEAAVPKHVEHLDAALLNLLDPSDRELLERVLRKIRDTTRPGSTAGSCPVLRPT